MARSCSICCHPQRGAIDRDLLAGVPNRRIAAQRAVSEQAVRRHRATHLPEHLSRAADADQAAHAGSLLEQMQALQAATLRVLQESESQRTALAAVAQARGNIQLLAELTGKLAAAPNVNVLVSPSWVVVRHQIMTALEEFPAARVAVANQLMALDAVNANTEPDDSSRD